MYGLLKVEAVGRLFEDHKAGREDNHKILFSLVMLEQWLRSFQSTGRRDSVSPSAVCMNEGRLLSKEL
jgi:asparagine synthase (glutamine-hydrolysing)